LILTKIIRYSIFALFAVSLFSCRKVFDTAKWAPEVAFPIAYTSLTIDNLLSDTANLKKDSSGFYSVVYKQNLDSLSLDVLKPFNAPPFFQNFKLDSLRLEVPSIIQSFTLGQVANTLIAGGGSNALLGLGLKFLDGKPLSALGTITGGNLPPTLEFPLGVIPISLNQFFQSAQMRSGQMEIKITNKLPLKVIGLDYQFLNGADNSVLVSETGLTIDVNSSVTKIYDLAGKNVSGNLNVNIPKLILETVSTAIINLAEGLEVSVVFKNLQVESATAVFPDQDVIVDNQSPSLEDMGELELKEAIIEDGALVMDVTSTIQDSIFITYRMPKTTQNGVPLLFEGVIPPATASSNTVIQLKTSMKDYTINLSSGPDYFNRFVYEFKARVKNTGKIVSLNLKDSIVVNVRLSDVKPRYVRGYLGSIDTSFASSLTTDIFSKIQAQRIEPEKVKISLNVENGLGLSGNVNLKSLKATNSKSESVTAIDPDFIGKDFTVNAATNPPFMVANTSISSGSNSNLPQLVSILPNKLDYLVDVKVGGLPKDTNSFVFNTSKLKPELHIEMPLKVSVLGLVLRDTIDINPAELGLETKGGALKLLAYNGFPFSATIKTTFYGGEGDLVVLTGNQAMQAAEIDPVSGRVSAVKYSKIELPFDASQLSNISKSKKVIIEAQFNTPTDQKVKLYADYHAQLTLTGFVAPKVSR
jgi:hypothetical protein